MRKGRRGVEELDLTKREESGVVVMVVDEFRLVCLSPCRNRGGGRVEEVVQYDYDGGRIENLDRRDIGI